MKRLLLSTALLAAGLLCGCEKEGGYGRFEPTLPGYYMFQQEDTALCGELSELVPVFAFSIYYAADTDEEREKIHDAFFYSSRISQKGDEWRIIDTDSELVIDTGGTSLSENGAKWTYRYADRSDCYGEEFPAITSEDGGMLTLCLPETPEREFYTAGLFPVKAAYEYRRIPSGAYVHSIRITLSGNGTTYTDDIDIHFRITSPLEFDSFSSYIGKGSMTLSTVTGLDMDTAKADYMGENGDITIEYNRYVKTWNRRSEYPFRYE